MSVRSAIVAAVRLSISDALMRLAEWVAGPSPGEVPTPFDDSTAGRPAVVLSAEAHRMRAEGAAVPSPAPGEAPPPLAGSIEARVAAARRDRDVG